MDESKELYLSDVLDTSLFEKNRLNVICAPCGSGKTVAAINKIASLASSPRKAIYLIDTRIGKDRLSLEKKLSVPYYAYADSIYNPNIGFFENMEKVGVTTYAQFGYWCSYYPNFAERYEVIVCDEVHNLVSFSEIVSKDKEDLAVHQKARSAICNAVRSGKVMVVGITATPEPLEKLSCQQKLIPIDTTNLHCYKENKIIPYCSINSLLQQIPLGKRGGLYVKHVKPMIRYGDVLLERGINPLLLWSLDYKEKRLSDEQLAAWQYLIDKEEVPLGYDMFLFNATAETSINIRSHMDFFIVHDTNWTHITQARGRYRGDLETLYIYKPKCIDGIIIPEEFLNKPLFREDLKLLRAFLDIKKDAHSNILSINAMMDLISKCGYKVVKSEVKRKQCWMITAA